MENPYCSRKLNTCSVQHTSRPPSDGRGGSPGPLALYLQSFAEMSALLGLCVAGHGNTLYGKGPLPFVAVNTHSPPPCPNHAGLSGFVALL